MADGSRTASLEELRQEAIRLGPWHIEIDITPELSTRATLDAASPTDAISEFKGMSFQSPGPGFMRKMKRIFPNVVEGDRITGLNVPGIGAQFFLNGAPIGEVEDPDFAPAFFGIWLDPGTSRLDFRKRLLGE